MIKFLKIFIGLFCLSLIFYITFIRKYNEKEYIIIYEDVEIRTKKYMLTEDSITYIDELGREVRIPLLEVKQVNEVTPIINRGGK